MTSNKQVSPAIRISQGKEMRQHVRLISKPLLGRFPVTTNERKQMSTKTNFKRIALVAVAALGLGLVSSVPSDSTAVEYVASATSEADAAAAMVIVSSFDVDTSVPVSAVQ